MDDTAVRDQDRLAVRRPALRDSLRRLARETTAPSAYRTLASQTKYPVGAMLVSQTILNFGVTAALSRTLGARAYGEYAVALTIAGIFQLLAAFPVEQGLPKFLAEAREEEPREVRAYYAAGLTARLAVGGLALLLACLCAPRVAGAFGQAGVARAVPLAAVAVCLVTPLALFFLACVQGMEQPRRWATGNLANSLAVFPLALLGALGAARWGLPGVFAGIAAGWGMGALACAVLARRALGFLLPRPVPWLYFRRLIPFLLPMWLVPLVGFGVRTVLKLDLARRCGPIPVGQFELALSLLVHMGTVYYACMVIFLPLWTRLYVSRQGSELLRSIGHARGALLGIALLYGAVLAFAGQWVVPAVFGSDQAGAVPAVRVMGLTMPLMIGGWVASVTHVISNRTRNVGLANLVWLCVVMPLGLLLIPRWGALGVAVAWCCAYVAFAWFYISRARPFFAEIEGWASKRGTAT